MARVAKASMTKLPRYRYDPSKTIIATVDAFSTVRFDYNHYSVPVKYVGKEVSIKGYGNDLVIMYRNIELDRYHRCYERGKTKYQLSHYLDLIETRPRSVFNAKPVKSNISAELLELGRRLSGPREMVKLLRLLVDHGEDKIMAAINCLRSSELSVAQIQAHLIPVTTASKIHSAVDIQVVKPQFNKYNALMNGSAAL